MRRVLRVVVLALGCASVGCSDPPPEPEPPEPGPVVVEPPAEDPEEIPVEHPEVASIGTPEEVREGIRLALEDLDSVAGSTTALRTFYERRDFHPGWFRDGQVRRDRLEALVAALAECERHGLRSEDYDLERLRELLEAADPERAVTLEITASGAFLHYAAHVVAGKLDPIKHFPTWNAPRRERDLVLALREALSDEGDVRAVLESLAPRDPRYAAMVAAITALRAVEEPAAVGAGPVLRLGATGPRVLRLRARLRALSLGESGGALAREGAFDEALRDALSALQTQHGRTASGELDAETRALVDRPFAERIADLRVNLERWRWMPAELGDPHLFVNIPAFSLEVVAGDGVAMQMKVMVGKPYRRTPVFSAPMQYLVFNPRWTAPPTVVRQDLFPRLRRGTGVLRSRGLQVVDFEGRVVDPDTIRWDDPSSRANLLFRQPPGPNNALGPVKFMLPNDDDIYLHGTPRHDLFEEDERAFSSGCVRVEHPRDLAAWLLREEDGFTREDIDAIVATRRTRTVHLPSPVPVHLQYLTAFADREGTIQWRADVYERDAELLAALDTRPQ